MVDEGLEINAKLDTGANMSSLCAEDIKIQTKDNKSWVTFSICGTHNKKVTALLYKLVTIRSRIEENSNSIKRPVIFLKTQLGTITEIIPVNLADRHRFHYPMLLGKDALIKFKIIVDPSR